MKLPIQVVLWVGLAGLGFWAGLGSATEHPETPVQNEPAPLRSEMVAEAQRLEMLEAENVDLRQRIHAALEKPRDLESNRETESEMKAVDRALLDRAAERMEEMIGRRDVDDLCRLFSDLLGQGERGFAKITELLPRFENALADPQSGMAEALKAARPLELLQRLTQARAHEIIGYGLSLRDVPQDDLPKLAQDIRRSIVDDLGQAAIERYRGDDPALMKDFVLALVDSDSDYVSPKVIDILTRIPGPESLQALVGYVEYGELDVARHAVRAIADLRTEEGTAALERLLPRARDPRLAEEIERVVDR